MNIKKTSHTKAIIFTIIIGVLLTGVIAYLLYTAGRHATPVAQPKTQQTEPSSATKTGLSSSNGSSPTTNINKTTNQIPVSTSMSISIDTLIEQNGTVNYSGTVTNPVVGGNCSAVFTSKINRPITLSPTYSAGKCGPDTISANSFTSIGTWTLTIRYFTNTTQVSASKDINIQ